MCGKPTHRTASPRAPDPRPPAAAAPPPARLQLRFVLHLPIHLLATLIPLSRASSMCAACYPHLAASCVQRSAVVAVALGACLPTLLVYAAERGCRSMFLARVRAAAAAAGA